MPGNERRKRACELCGKSPRSCRQIESGQWACHTCLKMFKSNKPKRGPDAPPTPKQIARASKLSIEILPGTTRLIASKMIALREQGFMITEELLSQDTDQLCLLHDNLMLYVMDLWEQLHTQRPKQVGIPWKDQQAFAASIVLHHREVAEACLEIQSWRDDVATERSLNHAQRHDDWEVSSRDFKPPIPQDETSCFVAERAQNRWSEYRPGFLSGLLGW